MSQAMINALRQARQSRIESGKYTFIIVRPTDLEYTELMRNKKIYARDLFERFVLGWEGVTELDIHSGGSNDPAEFSVPLFTEWISDHPELWRAITEGIVGLYKQHEAKLEEEAKNSGGG